MMKIKIFMIVVLIEIYTFISLTVTVIISQGHSNDKQFETEILCSYSINLKLCMIVDYVKYVMNIPHVFVVGGVQGR